MRVPGAAPPPFAKEQLDWLQANGVPLPSALTAVAPPNDDTAILPTASGIGELKSVLHG